MTTLTPQWHYLPAIESAEIIHRHEVGPICIECYANLKSAGAIQYRYMVAVYPSGKPRPLLLITCETSPGLALSAPGQFALGVFLPNGHRTLDVSEAYGQAAYFFDKATGVIESFFADGQSHTA